MRSKRFGKRRCRTRPTITSWYVLGSGVLKSDTIPDIRRDFPNIRKPGYLTVNEFDLRGRFKTLVEELESPEFTEELSRKFGKDLHPSTHIRA